MKLWKTFTDCFNCLPIAAIVDEKIFCCHGGLSPDLQSMEQIRRIMRPTDVPDTGLLCDLLWSDPDKDVQGWGENDRGVSFTFGADVVSKFLNRHDLDLICRAHQVCQQSRAKFAKESSLCSREACLVRATRDINASIYIFGDLCLPNCNIGAVVVWFLSGDIAQLLKVLTASSERRAWERYPPRRNTELGKRQGEEYRFRNLLSLAWEIRHQAN